MVGEGCKMMRIVWVCCALVISQLPATVSAQSTKQSAKLLFKSGNENFNAKRYAKALDAFKRATALSPHPVMLKYIGNVYRAMWNYTRAIEYYRRYINQSPKDANQIRSLVAQLQAERASWPALKFKTNPAGASIRIGESQAPIVGVSPLTLRLPAGRHEFFLTKPGYSPLKRSILFEGRGTKSLTITMQADGGPIASVPVVQPVKPPVVKPAKPVMPAAKEVRPQPTQVKPAARPIASTPSPQAVQPRVVAQPIQPTQSSQQPPSAQPQGVGERVEPTGSGWTRRTWSWVGLGSGGALLVGGLAMGAVAAGTNGDLDTCRSNPACARTEREVAIAGDVGTQALVADVLFVTGAVAASVGLALYLVSGDDADGAAFMMTPTPHGVGATGIFRF